MTRRFRFLVVDDQYGLEGYERFIEFLKLRGYLKKGYPTELHTGRDNTFKGENRDENQSMTFRVFSSKLDFQHESGFTFSEAFSEFEQILKTRDYDFFVFDLKFAGAKGNQDSNTMDPTFHDDDGRVNTCTEANLYKYYPNWSSPEDYTQPKQSSEKNKSRYIAGLQSFLLKTPLDERPKFIYSAAEETQDLIKYMTILRSRFSDVFILRQGFHTTSEETSDVIEAVVKLDAYLRKRQIEIISYLNKETITKLKQRVQERIDFDVADIPDCDDHNWSLHTLFPKQINNIEKLKDVELHVGHILQLLTNYPLLVKNIFIHQTDRKELDILRELEFEKDYSNKQTCIFKPIHSFFGDFHHRARNELDGIHNDIEKEFEGKFLACSRNDQINVNRIKEWSLNIGFYVGHLHYIQQIAALNANKIGQTYCFRFSEIRGERGNLCGIILVFEFTGKKNLTNDSFVGIIQKTSNILNDRKFTGHNSEGTQDILKIVCYCYQGAFYFRGNQRAIKCFYLDGHIKVKDIVASDELDAEFCNLSKLENNQVQYVIRITD